MAVSHRIESQQISGLLSGFVATDVQFATVSGAFTMSRLDLRLTDAPSGGTVDVMVNTVTGGGGAALLQGTIADGTRFISVTGDIAFSGTTSFYLRVVSESGFAMGLSASVEISTLDGGTVTVLLSTLQNVKDSAAITGSTNDAIIQRHLEGVSKEMQNWMDRQIITTVRTVERHFPVGLGTAIVVDDYPVNSVEEVRQSGSVMDVAGYRVDGGRLLRRVSSGSRRLWEKSEIEIDYTTGYAAVPADLVDACTQETVRRWRQTIVAGAHGAHVTSISPEAGDGKTFESAGFMPQTIQAMQPYRRRF